MVELKEPTQSWTTGDRTLAPSFGGGGEKQQVSHPLMISFVMVVRHELANRAAQRAFADQDQSIETRFFDGPHEAFRERIEIGGMGRQADGLDTRRAQRLAKRIREERIAIVKEVAFADEASLDRPRQIRAGVRNGLRTNCV